MIDQDGDRHFLLACTVEVVEDPSRILASPRRVRVRVMLGTRLAFTLLLINIAGDRKSWRLSSDGSSLGADLNQAVERALILRGYLREGDELEWKTE